MNAGQSRAGAFRAIALSLFACGALLCGCSTMVLPRSSAEHIPPELTPAPQTESELVIYLFPAPADIDYGGPRSLLVSFVKAGLDFTEKSDVKHAIGHAFIRLRSGDEEVLTGQTTDGSWEEADVVRKHGYGLGYLGTTFIGRLDDAESLTEELEDRFETGEMVYIRFLLSRETAARMMRYFHEYRDRGHAGWWGEANRPRYGEGSACASFATSFLDVGGLLRPAYERAWTVSFRIPRTMYGGPLFGEDVAMGACLARTLLTSRWADADEEHVLCLLWDPTLIHHWAVKTWDHERQYPTGNFVLEQTRRVRGLVLDARGVPTPDGPLWLNPAESPNVQGRQPGSRTPVERPEALPALHRAMQLQRARMRELGMIR